MTQPSTPTIPDQATNHTVHDELWGLIRKARESAFNLSVEDFATLIGATVEEVANLEAGQPGVDAHVLMRAIAVIGADQSVVAVIRQRVAMLEVASIPVEFPKVN